MERAEMMNILYSEKEKMKIAASFAAAMVNWNT